MAIIWLECTEHTWTLHTHTHTVTNVTKALLMLRVPQPALPGILQNAGDVSSQRFRFQTEIWIKPSRLWVWFLNPTPPDPSHQKPETKSENLCLLNAFVYWTSQRHEEESFLFMKKSQQIYSCWTGIKWHYNVKEPEVQKEKTNKDLTQNEKVNWRLNKVKRLKSRPWKGREQWNSGVCEDKKMLESRKTEQSSDSKSKEKNNK